MNVKRALADVENCPPKRPRRSCCQRVSYVKRDKDNSYYQQDSFEPQTVVKKTGTHGDLSDKEKHQETGEEIEDKRVEVPQLSNETIIILSLRVELARRDETITKLESELSDLTKKLEDAQAGQQVVLAEFSQCNASVKAGEELLATLT
ncbi:hypothetical protein VNI00_018091 [Paramarasmius palmivorus]|uniref:Uncharacterized protein n=1 Tax=Paramarasmius palmivorus TaxID=297713 RepID=A0AAW0B0J5_9AGAR